MLQSYFRVGPRGEKIISPWHHYQLQIIEKQMKDLDPHIYETQYKLRMSYMREMKVGKGDGS